MGISVVTVAYGPVPHLRRSLQALAREPEVDEVIVVDNGVSPDELAAAVDGTSAKVLDAGANLGFGGGCNLGAAAATGEVLAFVNPDAVVEPGALAQLLQPLSDPEVGIASASVRLLDQPRLLNSAGGAVHYTGLGWSIGFGAPACSFAEAREVAAASGAAMAIRASDFELLGGFAEELFLYHEDAELSLRMWLRGKRVVYVPGAVVLHDYDFARNPGKLHYLERNRLIVLATCFELRTLAALSPALVAVELGMLLLAVAQGWAGEKVDGYRWLARHRRWVRERRRRVQADRLRSDEVLRDVLAARVDPAQIPVPGLLRPANAVLVAYWAIVSRALWGGGR